MTTEIYFKKVVDLTSKEIMLIYDKHQDCAYPLSIPRYDKTGIVMNLVSIEPNFLLNLEKKYFFRKTVKDLKYDPDFTGEGTEKTARADHVMDIDKINKLIMLNNLNSVLAQIKDESEEGKTGNQGSTSSTQTGPAPGPGNDQTHGKKTDSPPESSQRPAPGSHANTAPRSKSAQNPTTSSGKLKMKTPRFDYQLPIENWLSAMELYMSCPRVGKMLENAGQWGGGGVDPPAHPPSGRGGSLGGFFPKNLT
jgi:hypothetical protein